MRLKPARLFIRKSAAFLASYVSWHFCVFVPSSEAYKYPFELHQYSTNIWLSYLIFYPTPYSSHLSSCRKSEPQHENLQSAQLIGFHLPNSIHLQLPASNSLVTMSDKPNISQILAALGEPSNHPEDPLALRSDSSHHSSTTPWRNSDSITTSPPATSTSSNTFATASSSSLLSTLCSGRSSSRRSSRGNSICATETKQFREH